MVFLLDKSHKLIPSVYTFCNNFINSGKIGYSGSADSRIRIAKYGKGCVASHKEDFERILRYYFKYSHLGNFWMTNNEGVGNFFLGF